jgi:glutamine synthetase
MAKPFAETGGSGLHVHASLYDEKGQNVFAGNGDGAEPDVSQLMRHAIGGMAKTMAPAMAIFAPNANSYRRYGPGSYVPLYPHWGYNHRNVPLRIPLSSDNNRRIEHRVAGADANPYLVVAAVLAGMHYGITQQSDPGPMVAQSAQVPEEQAVLPDRWEKALDLFDGSEVMKSYLGDNYFAAFSATRRLECNEFHARISNLDYEWYLRAL